MSERGFLSGAPVVSARTLLALALLSLALGAAGALVWSKAARGGDGALTQPSDPPRVESSYAAVIRPLLDAKCSACHGEKKQKAGLSLATPETIVKGGRHGSPLDRAEPEKSLMLARIDLALDEEKHMPPDDRDQLAPQELASLERWIRAGAPFEGAVAGIDEPVSAAPAGATPPESAAAVPQLALADPQALAALRDALVHVQPVSEGSRSLSISFAAAAKTFDDAQVEALLAPLREQVADLSLARSAVGDATLRALAAFPALRRLDVRGTAISDAGIAALAHHAALAELVLAQNQLSDACVESLSTLPALERVHLWRSGIGAEAIARLRAARPKLAIDDGADAASAALDAETRVVLSKAPPQAAPASSTAAPSLVPFNAKCPVSGAPVDPRYSVVHDGRVIGFCCPDCPKTFWADPAKFAGRLQ